MNGRPPKVLGAGLVALDLVISPDPTAPIQAWAGGTCGNVMAILAWHGWDAYPVARMNGDAASERVRADLRRWGVHLDLAGCTPVSHTPIIVEEIKRSAGGDATHRFVWACPSCGGWLPSFKPVTRDAVEQAEPYVPGTSVFFLDRVSRGTLQLASLAAAAGALVFFEPSGRGEKHLFAEALGLAHVVKYSDQRFAELAGGSEGENRLLEIQTLGMDGLRYRMPKRRNGDIWQTLEANTAKQIVDTCGSGDWCSGGLISQVADGGLANLERLKLGDVRDGLMYGQELAAWNCEFEGARGGMYSTDAGSAPLVTQPLRGTVVGPDLSGIPSSKTVVECPKCDAA